MTKINNNGEVWEAESAQTDTTPLFDGGHGKPIILRTFDFKLPPMESVPANQDLLDANIKAVKTFLWKDELVMIQDPKVVKAKDNLSFRIFATCQAKSGSVILDTPLKVQDIFNARN